MSPTKKATRTRDEGKGLNRWTAPKQIFWVYRGNFYASTIESVCPFCKEPAVIELPPELKAAQDDGTTHVCHPAVGGCNHGFAKEEV